MNWTEKFSAWFWPPEVAHPELETLQLRLLRRLLWMTLALLVPLSLRNWMQGLINPLIPALMLATPLLCLGTLRQWPALRRTVVFALIASFQGLIAWTGYSMGIALSPAATFFSGLGACATILDGPRLGNLFTLSSLVLLALLMQALPMGADHSTHLYSNLIICAVFMQGIALSFYSAFSSVQGRLLERNHSLHVLRSQRHDLTQALFGDLQSPLVRLREALALKELPAAEESLRHLSGLLAASRHLKGGEEEAMSSAQADLQENAQEALTLAMLETSLKVIFLVFVISTVRNVFIGGNILPQILSMIALASALVVHRRHPLQLRTVTRSLLLLFVLVINNGTFTWIETKGLPPHFPYLPFLILAGAFLGGRLEAYFMALFGLLTLAYYLGGAGLEHSALHLHFLGDYAAQVIFMLFFCLGALWMNAKLASYLRDRSVETLHDLKVKRRLLGTLFHDVNNPLMALRAVLALPAAGVPLNEGDHERLRRLAARSEHLIRASQRFLLDEARLPADDLVAVDVATLFGETQELFEARLKAKRQHLTFHSPEGLAVLAQPELLRDSVLSNLVSNALKFAQPGAGLALEAREEGGSVTLSVRDSGPGLPAAVKEALRSGGPMPSHSGTNGEAGQGLGLFLVKEHLARMGGRLDFRSELGEGTEIRVLLPQA